MLFRIRRFRYPYVCILSLAEKQGMKEYIGFLQGNRFLEETDKYEFLLLQSVTKFIVLLGFMDCCETYTIDIHDSISEHFPTNLNVTFLEIINHATRIEGEWFTITKTGRLIPSALQKQYFKAQDIYAFALAMKIDPKLKEEFNYNNFAYNILAATIEKYSGEKLTDFLEKTLLKEVRYKWETQHGKAHTAFGLAIHTSTMKRFLQNTVRAIKRHNLNFYWGKIKRGRDLLIGHTGSGGQFFYYNKQKDCICIWAYYGEEKPGYEEERTYPRYFEIFERF